VSARADADRERERAVLRADRLTLGQAQAALARDPTLTLAWLKELSLDSPEWPAALALARQAVAHGVARVLTDGQQGNVDQLAVARDGRIASAGPDHVVRLWDPERLAAHALAGHHGAVRSRLAFSPDGAVRLWDLAELHGRVIQRHGDAVKDLELSPDGKLVAAAGGDKLVRLSTLAGEQPRTLAGHAAGIKRLAFSPDGTLLASAAMDHTVRVWEVASGNGRALDGHAAQVNALAFSPDGHTLYSGSDDGSLRAWTLTAPPPPPSAPAAMPAWLAARTNLTVPR
jgi:WD40 repeat protein